MSELTVGECETRFDFSRSDSIHRNQAASEVCSRVDWRNPELRISPAYDAFESGDMHQAAVLFVQYLRNREVPFVGYSATHIRRLRECAEPTWMEEASRRWENVFGEDILMPYHGNAFAALGEETILVATTSERCRRMAEKVLENTKRWEQGYWGVTHSLCRLLSFLWPLSECRDQDLVPIFGWLLRKSAVEWEEARAWDETILGTSGHNWWAHTFFGFWMMGTFFPEFKETSQFRALGSDYLERELSLLFEADGWSKEGSPGYHEFATQNLMEFVRLVERSGGVLSDRSRQRLRTIANAGWQLFAPDGDYPLFADFVRVGQYKGFHGQGNPGNSSCATLRKRAAFFSLPSAKYVAQALDPDWKPLFRGRLSSDEEDLAGAYRKLDAVEPVLDTSLPESGLYVMRQNWTRKADYAAIVAGPLGARVTSHKHADIFSFELYSRGRRILVDNGYGTIHEERKDQRVRMWRIGSSAHNTTTVDDEDQVPIPREFYFEKTVVPVVDDWRSDVHFVYFSGAHEGYIRLDSPVPAVRRKLFYLRNKYWILIDRFTAASQMDEHAYRLHFHLNVPAIMDERTGRVTTRGEGGNLVIVPVLGANGLAVLEANPYPIEGYENPQHLCYTRYAKGNDLFVTVLVPFENEVAPEVEVSLKEIECDNRSISPWEGTGLSLQIDGESHFYFDQHMQWNLPWRGGGYSGKQRLFHSACMASDDSI